MSRLNIDIKSETLEAENRIRGLIRETPLERSAFLSKECGGNVYLKLENYQVTGSFKARGALNKILSLDRESKTKNLVTSSTGNHGAAFTWALNTLGLKGTVYVPENISPAKLETLKLYGADIEFYGNDCARAEAYARKISGESGRIFISPYNDPKILGGHGTSALEIEKQARGMKIDSVLVPVGGGGLISGIAGYLKESAGKIEITGCQPVRSAVMAKSILAGEILDIESEPTISDATAGGIEEGSITFDLCAEYVDNFILVSEKEIKEAISLILRREFMLIEGAAALTVASFLKEIEKYRGKTVILIISGAKLGLNQLKDIFCHAKE
ncbi:MAG TPA: threonine/serine dehydratase [Candidatus Krumholzibacteriaceae bacterium]|nr:threonine/serine dehydratase [Candidatus Krumholzibacteriaceae bacterium]